jgi:hypothetical protein
VVLLWSAVSFSSCLLALHPAARLTRRSLAGGDAEVLLAELGLGSGRDQCSLRRSGDLLMEIGDLVSVSGVVQSVPKVTRARRVRPSSAGGDTAVVLAEADLAADESGALCADRVIS